MILLVRFAVEALEIIEKQVWMGWECESSNGLLQIDFYSFIMVIGPLLERILYAALGEGAAKLALIRQKNLTWGLNLLFPSSFPFVSILQSVFLLHIFFVPTAFKIAKQC